MKTITIAGNIGRDAELKSTQGGTQVCKFSVAVKARKKEDPATWFNVSIFGKRGEALNRFLTKGTAVCIAGDLEARTYQAKDGSTKLDLGIVASEVTLMGGGGNGGQRREEKPDSSGFDDSHDDGFGGDIPF